MRRTPDLLVIGGGVIGCAVARAAARAGLSVLCVERGAFGGEASGAAAGLLAVASGTEPPGPRLALRAASRARFPALAAALHAETGIDVEYAPTGVLDLAFDASDVANAPARAAACRAQGFAVEWLDTAALRAAAPGASPAACGALRFPDEACVHPRRLVEALAAAARTAGAELVPGLAVRGAERRGARIGRVRVGAEWVEPGLVVLAAGAWAARVPDVAPDLPVAPARGQMLALRPAVPPAAAVLAHGDDYLVPRRDGEVWVGATVEHVGFDRTVTPDGLAALHATIGRLAPALRAAPVVRVWAGLRPWTPAGGPLLGRAPGCENLLLACGHYRSGILLAPITAEVVTALAAGGEVPVALDPFAPSGTLPPAARGA